MQVFNKHEEIAYEEGSEDSDEEIEVKHLREGVTVILLSPVKESS